MAQPQFLIQVNKNKTRDAAIITATTGTGTQEPLVVSKTDGKSGRTSLSLYGSATRIPEDTDATPLMRSGVDTLDRLRFQVGAYIMRLIDPESIARIMGNFGHEQR